ncbi:AAA family ATPase [Sinobacterium caligoides]|nr:ATP-binding protein [Sinobacterium caligoides]
MPITVLTGPPCSGKSTLCNALHKAGYNVVEESALAVIRSLCQRLGITEQHQWQQQNPLAFHQLILEQQVCSERQALQRKPSSTRILDRSRLDILAYLRLAQCRPSKEFLRLAHAQQYDQVLFLEALPRFIDRHDSGRTEDKDSQSRIADQLQLVYQEQGYHLNYLPASSPRRRLEQALAVINQFTADSPLAAAVGNSLRIPPPRHC